MFVITISYCFICLSNTDIAVMDAITPRHGENDCKFYFFPACAATSEWYSEYLFNIGR